MEKSQWIQSGFAPSAWTTAAPPSIAPSATRASMKRLRCRGTPRPSGTKPSMRTIASPARARANDTRT